MGLASSQVRLLTLTSDEVKLKSEMMITSNRKMALNNQMLKLASKKQSMLKQHELNVTTGTGELRRISYEYIMGKVGGVQDITTKSTNDMILFEKKSGRVILTSEMAKLVGSHNSINKNINAVYTAVGRLCGDTYIEIQNNDGVSNYAIGPDLVKAIIEGKFDNPTYESINDAIDQYKLYKYDPNASYIYSQEASNNKFCLTGNTPNEWVSNMSKLVNDVKFYYSLVLACSKFGHTNAYDSHLNDNAYVDNEIQNGTFLLMEYNSKNSQLNVSHNTDYYIRSADIWKMSSYSNQAEVQAWYEAERNAIKDKEKFLDTQLQTMNTELSSITTEIESIKSLIEDSIPKSFEWAT